MVQQAVPDQLIATFVDTGMLRQGEATQVATTLKDRLGVELITVNAESQFLKALQGVTAPSRSARSSASCSSEF